MPLTLADREWIEQRALAAGFDLAGMAAVPQPSSAPASEDDRRYAQWIDAGHAGEMEYLKRADDSGEYIRGDLRRSMPWARSVIVCAVNYNAAAPTSIDPADSKAGWIARYAWSGKASGEGVHKAVSENGIFRIAADVFKRKNGNVLLRGRPIKKSQGFPVQRGHEPNDQRETSQQREGAEEPLHDLRTLGIGRHPCGTGSVCLGTPGLRVWPAAV